MQAEFASLREPTEDTGLPVGQVPLLLDNNLINNDKELPRTIRTFIGRLGFARTTQPSQSYDQMRIEIYRRLRSDVLDAAFARCAEEIEAQAVPLYIHLSQQPRP